jgi:hypothetical protein
MESKAGRPVHGDGWVADNLRALLNELPKFDMVVADALAQTGYGRKTLAELLREMDALPKDAKLTAPMAAELTGAMSELLKVLKVESGRRYAYVPESGRFDVELLMNNVARLFAPGVYARLPELVRYDLAEAGRCVAFNLPTASAFHALRAIEGALRDFYCDWVRSGRLKNPMWASMVTQMRDRSSAPPEGLLDQLDSLRIHFRNPTPPSIPTRGMTSMKRRSC